MTGSATGVLYLNLKLGVDFNGGDFLARLADFTPEAVYREKLGLIEGLMEEPDRGKVVLKLGNGIEVFNSVPTAICSFLSRLQSFARAVVQAISLGGDTDTVAAMTGAISGAYLSVTAIPVNWRDQLENRRYIEELGERLFTLAGG
ncbi:MAG: ADP-ribosylglycohydrolase family protein [Dehalococcoidales bacterium]|jgi:poly(ADP-ribose) glycohydrolase ARH3|nr:ADP-ribosylglycohydrolase family protein [Dehalococcoidales bacterium]MDP7286238.1 ADP-ribosylglycohydrolase family protein [Dehalococcoidales bacterium]MDP7415877.1 ADP-ribosylglycohydrolase family protein [Dehalococcoidales bacterium]